MIAVGYCKHGNKIAAIKVEAAEPDELTEFAYAWDRVEFVQAVQMGGECKPCREIYERNCITLGITA